MTKSTMALRRFSTALQEFRSIGAGHSKHFQKKERLMNAKSSLAGYPHILMATRNDVDAAMEFQLLYEHAHLHFQVSVHLSARDQLELSAYAATRQVVVWVA